MWEELWCPHDVFLKYILQINSKFSSEARTHNDVVRPLYFNSEVK